MGQTAYIIGQIFGGIAIALGFVSYQVKTQRQLIFMQTATAAKSENAISAKKRRTAFCFFSKRKSRIISYTAQSNAPRANDQSASAKD